MINKTQDIVSLMIQYISELETLDQLNNSYIMTCIGAIGVILSIIATIVSVNYKVWKTLPYRIMAPLFLSIPIISCIFLGVVTINCRKVDMYRSYLVYLEDSYNQIEGVIPQYYNSTTQQFLSKWWITNPNGSLMNRVVDISFIVIIGLLITVCFILAHISFNKMMQAKSYKGTRKGIKLKILFYVSYILILVVCITVCTACIFDLIVNNVTVERVLREFPIVQ